MEQPKLKDVKIDIKGTKKMRSSMANKSSPSNQRNIARNADKLGALLGLIPNETVFMKNKAKISSIAVKNGFVDTGE
jgi:hypothetical protein